MDSPDRRRFLATLAAAGNGSRRRGARSQGGLDSGREEDGERAGAPEKGGRPALETRGKARLRRQGGRRRDVEAGDGRPQGRGADARLGASAVEAGEKGINAVELDPNDTSVGLGGFPNEEGIVELDAAVMTGTPHRYGAVAGLRGIATPCSVSSQGHGDDEALHPRRGGAKRFALSLGFEDKGSLLTEKSRKAWLEWRAKRGANDAWVVPDGSHDTIGYLGSIRRTSRGGPVHIRPCVEGPGACRRQPHRRRGALRGFRRGAACATGVGEEVLRTVGSGMIVEMMRHGASPQEAVERGARADPSARARRRRGTPGSRWPYLAIDLAGEIGAAALSPEGEFEYARWKGGMGQPELAQGPPIRR